MPSEPTGSSVDFEKVGTDYFQQRELKKGAAGWVLLVGLGVAYVISRRLRRLELRPGPGRLGAVCSSLLC